MTQGFVKKTNKDPFVEQAIRVALSTYGDNISVISKKKDLIKFGRNNDVTNATTGSTIMGFVGGEDHETYVSTNVINTISSSSTSDTVEIGIEGHTISGGVFTFVSQTKTLQGQTQVTLDTPLARCTRLYNNNSTDLVGNVYGYQSGQTVTAGVPQDGTKTHCIITAGKNQSEKCSTTISNSDYWIITKFTANLLEKTSAFADVELQLRLVGGVFRTLDIVAISAGAGSIEDQRPYLIIPKNSDVRLVAVGSNDSIEVAGSIHGMLASVVT
jgi:hypothetical protein